MNPDHSHPHLAMVNTTALRLLESKQAKTLEEARSLAIAFVEGNEAALVARDLDHQVSFEKEITEGLAEPWEVAQFEEELLKYGIDLSKSVKVRNPREQERPRAPVVSFANPPQRVTHVPGAESEDWFEKASQYLTYAQHVRFGAAQSRLGRAEKLIRELEDEDPLALVGQAMPKSLQEREKRQYSIKESIRLRQLLDAFKKRKSSEKGRSNAEKKNLRKKTLATPETGQFRSDARTGNRSALDDSTRRPTKTRKSAR